MSVLKLLDELEEIIESSPNVPLSGKALMDREELLEILKEIRIVLPDEIKQAQWIKQERNAILEEAQNEADSLMGQAKEHVQSLIENDTIVKESSKKAEGILQKAEETAREISRGSLTYADGILEKLQSDLSSVMEALEDNRRELHEMKNK